MAMNAQNFKLESIFNFHVIVIKIMHGVRSYSAQSCWWYATIFNVKTNLTLIFLAGIYFHL